MPPEEKIARKVRQLAGRLRALHLQSRLALCAFIAAAASVLVMAVHKTGYFDPVYEASVIIMIVGLLTGLAWGLLRRITPLQAAALTDERLNLRERLSSAVQFASQDTPSALVPALIQDAGEAAERIQPSRVYPYRPPRHIWHLCIAGLAFFALARFCPDDLLKTPAQVAVEREMKKQGKEAVKLARRMKKRAGAEDLRVSKRTAEKVEKLGRELEKARMSKKQALLKTQKLTKEIREQQRQLAEKNTPKSLKSAAKAMKKAGLNTKTAKAIADATGDMKLAEAAKKLEEAAEKAQKGELTPEEKKKLSEDLKKMAGALGDAGAAEMAESLQKAAEALDSDNMTQVAENLKNSAAAAKEYDKYAKDAEAMAQMKDAMEAMKDAMANADKPCEHGYPGGVGCPHG